MTRALFVALALLLSTDAWAADQKPTDAKAADPAVTSAKAKAEALKKKKEAEAAARSGVKGTPKQPTDSPKVAAMKRARAQLVYAADTCQNPSKCDKEMRDDFVEGFVSACRECDTVERCDAEKQAILEGNVPRGSDLCARPQK